MRNRLAGAAVAATAVLVPVSAASARPQVDAQAAAKPPSR